MSEFEYPRYKPNEPQGTYDHKSLYCKKFGQTQFFKGYKKQEPFRCCACSVDGVEHQDESSFLSPDNPIKQESTPPPPPPAFTKLRESSYIRLSERSGSECIYVNRISGRKFVAVEGHGDWQLYFPLDETLGNIRLALCELGFKPSMRTHVSMDKIVMVAEKA